MTPTTQEEIVKIQSKGLLTIPKRFRRELGFDEKSMVRVRKEKNRLVIEPLRVLSYPVRHYTDEDLKDFLEFDRQETRELKKKGLI